MVINYLQLSDQHPFLTKKALFRGDKEFVLFSWVWAIKQPFFCSNNNSCMTRLFTTDFIVNINHSKNITDLFEDLSTHFSSLLFGAKFFTVKKSHNIFFEWYYNVLVLTYTWKRDNECIHLYHTYDLKAFANQV